MAKPYYTLLIRGGEKRRWSPQFGDYDKQVVVQERRDSYSDVRKADWRIIKTNDQQKDIDAVIQRINALARMARVV